MSKYPCVKKKNKKKTTCYSVLVGTLNRILYTRVIQQHLIRWHWSQHFHFLLLIPCYPLHSFCLTPRFSIFVQLFKNYQLVFIIYQVLFYLEKVLNFFFPHLFLFLFFYIPSFWASLPSPSPSHPSRLIQSPCLNFLSREQIPIGYLFYI